EAFNLACSGEPGPTAVLIPYPLFIAGHKYDVPLLPPTDVPFDADGFDAALGILSNPRGKVGIYAGLGCMDYGTELVQLAEVLQAPVATSVSGKGVIPEDHPLSVGWGYGPQGTRAAEEAFKDVQTVLALGVRY